jgi:hypothetical protein
VTIQKEHLEGAAKRMRSGFGEETPLSNRERSMLRGELMTYAAAKGYIISLNLERGHMKRSITPLFLRTGGHVWKSRKQVDGIIEDAKREEATCTKS